MSRARTRKPTVPAAGARPRPARGVSITNMVFLGHLSRSIDSLLGAIALNGSYDPSAFTAWAVRPRSATATLAVFSNGKVIIAGARSELEARLAIEQLAFALSLQLGTYVTVTDLSVHNVVGSAYLGFEVDLARMYAENSLVCRYRPENFPGLQYSWYNDSAQRAQSAASDRGQRIAVVVFRSGSVVLTGARRRCEDLQHVYQELQPLFQRYRLGSASSVSLLNEAPQSGCPRMCWAVHARGPCR